MSIPFQLSSFYSINKAFFLSRSLTVAFMHLSLLVFPNDLLKNSISAAVILFSLLLVAAQQLLILRLKKSMPHTPHSKALLEKPQHLTKP